VEIYKEYDTLYILERNGNFFRIQGSGFRVGTIPLLCMPTINNVAVNHTLIDGGVGLNIISVEIFEKMQVPYHWLMPTRPFFGVTEGSTTPIG
jgi:hypothetical protein